MSVNRVGGLTYVSELYHHGIKGQKWGFRRYQNYDGTLTLEGKKRYQKLVDAYRGDLKNTTTVYNNLYDRIGSKIGSENLEKIRKKWHEEVNGPLNSGDYIERLPRKKRRELEYLSDTWNESLSRLQRDRQTFEDEYRTKHKFGRLLYSKPEFEAKVRDFSSKKTKDLPSSKEFQKINKKYGDMIDSITANLRNKTMKDIMRRVPDYAKDDVYDLIRFYMWDYT